MNRLHELAAVLSGQYASNDTRLYLERAEAELPGYHVLLLQIALSTCDGFTDDTRLLAAIQLKNGIDKCWRRTAKSPITTEDKAVVRQGLLEGCDVRGVPDKVAAQLAVATARVARLDFPHDWPELFEQVMGKVVVAQSDEAGLARCMRYTLQVVKSLCALRLTRARENFQRAAPDLLSFVTSAHASFSDRLLTDFEGCTYETILIADLSLKIARRLVCYGYELPYRDPLCRSFFARASSDVDRAWSIVGGLEMRNLDPRPRDELVRRYVVHLGKFFLELSNNTALESVAMNHNFVLMPGSLDLVRRYWDVVVSAADVSSRNHDCIRKVVVQGMMLLKGCIKLVALPSVSLRLMAATESDEVTQSLNLLKSDLFAPTPLARMLENLIIKFFVLRVEDLGDWENDPEGWMLSQEASHWQYEVRPCAERVFEDLFAAFKTELTQPLLGVLSQVKDATQNQELLVKEAIYNALGIAAQHLDEHFDFEAFIPRLRQDAEDDSMPAIFRRRITVLLSQWFTVRCGEGARPLVYEIVARQLSSDDDGVSLAAGTSVSAFLDDWDWHAASFEPFAEHFAQHLIRLLAVAEQTETKMKLVSGVGLLFERLRGRVARQVDPLLERLSIEWDDAGEEHLLAVSLLGLLTRVVLSQDDPALVRRCYPVAVPLIRHSTDPTNVQHIYLMEESLELLHALLQNAQEPDETLIQLFAIVLEPQCLGSATDSLRKLLYICESGTLLLGARLLELGIAQQLVGQLVQLLPSLTVEATSHVARTLEIGCLVSGCQAWSSEQVLACTALALQPDDNAVIEVCRLLVICRLIVADSGAVLRLWSASNSPEVPGKLLERLTDKFDNLSHPKHRKLCAMAATYLVAQTAGMGQDDKAVAMLGLVWSDVLAEIQSQAGEDGVYWPDDTTLQAVEDGVEPGGAEIQRRKRVNDDDPVLRTRFRQMVRAAAEVINVDLLGQSLQGLLE